MLKKLLGLALVLLFSVSSMFMFAGCDRSNGGDEGAGETPTGASHYLGTGYNVITSAYYNQKDAMIRFPILNMEKLKNYIKVDSDNSNSNDSTTIVATSVQDYTEKISHSANLSGGISFIKSFETNFSMAYDTATTTNDIFVTMLNILTRKRDYFYDCSTDILADNVADSFKNAVESSSAEALVKKYGTHILTDIELGGRYELNYLFHKKEGLENVNLASSVQASSSLLSGSTSAEYSESARAIMENSSMNFQSYGGAGSDTTSFESAKDTYPNWLASLDDTSKISLVNCRGTVPLWELVAQMNITDAQNKADAIEAYYNNLKTSHLSQMKTPTAINTKQLVKYIYVEYGDNANEAKAKLEGKGVPRSNILNIDLNSDAGGDYVYFGWTTTTDPNDAIRGIYGGVFEQGSGGQGAITVGNLSYTRYSTTDLNRDAGGPDMYLYCSKHKNAGEPITSFGYVCNDYTSKSLSGYSAITAKIDGSYRALDFNYDAGGDDIYIYFTRN